MRRVCQNIHPPFDVAVVDFDDFHNYHEIGWFTHEDAQRLADIHRQHPELSAEVVSTLGIKHCLDVDNLTSERLLDVYVGKSAPLKTPRTLRTLLEVIQGELPSDPSLVRTLAVIDAAVWSHYVSTEARNEVVHRVLELPFEEYVLVSLIAYLGESAPFIYIRDWVKMVSNPSLCAVPNTMLHVVKEKKSEGFFVEAVTSASSIIDAFTCEDGTVSTELALASCATLFEREAVIELAAAQNAGIILVGS